AVLVCVQGREQGAVAGEDLGGLGDGRASEAQVGRLPRARPGDEGERDQENADTDHAPLSLRYGARPWTPGPSSRCGRPRTCRTGWSASRSPSTSASTSPPTACTPASWWGSWPCVACSRPATAPSCCW